MKRTTKAFIANIQKDITDYNNLVEEIKKLNLFAKHIATENTEVTFKLSVVDLLKKEKEENRQAAMIREHEERGMFVMRIGPPETKAFKAETESNVSDIQSIKIVKLLLEDKTEKASAILLRLKEVGIKL